LQDTLFATVTDDKKNIICKQIPGSGIFKEAVYFAGRNVVRPVQFRQVNCRKIQPEGNEFFSKQGKTIFL
jgi:hypothetical protein